MDVAVVGIGKAVAAAATMAVAAAVPLHPVVVGLLSPRQLPVLLRL